MAVTYEKTPWVNDGAPYVNATNLNNIEDGIEACANEINTHEVDNDIHFSALERTKLAGIAAGAQVNPTATELLASIKTVDGAESGLDADTLDGNSSAAFVLASEISNYLNKITDTLDDIPDGTNYVKSQNNFTNALLSKLNDIESDATADQTASEIVALINASAEIIADARIAASVTRDSELSAAIANFITAAGVTLENLNANGDVQTAITDTNSMIPTSGAVVAYVGGMDGGDMSASTYDPTNVADDAFAMDNMVEGTTNKILSAAERTKLIGIEDNADVTDTTNVAAAGALMSSGGTMSGDVTMGNNDLISAKTATFNAEYDNGNSGTAKTIDWNSGQKQKLTLSGNCTISLTDLTTGVGNLILKLVQDATGSRTVTWPASVKWPSGTAPTLSTTANAVDIVSFYFDGTNYYGMAGFGFA